MLIRKGRITPGEARHPKPGDRRVTPPTAELDRTAVVRTRMPGGVGGEEPRGSPLSPSMALTALKVIREGHPVQSQAGPPARTRREAGGTTKSQLDFFRFFGFRRGEPPRCNGGYGPTLT